MKLYLAGPWADRAQMPLIAAKFEIEGHTITERWWEFDDVSYNEANAEALGDHALRDFVGVMKADALVIINSRMSEGKAVEMGMALVTTKPVIIVGPRTNVFQYLIPDEWVVDTVEAALEVLH